MSARARAAIAGGRGVAGVSRAAGRGRGQVIGGQVMLRVHPGIIRELAAHKQTTLVSATNGKSTTTRFIAEALRTRGPVAHNLTGANMAPGVATALAASPRAPYAALEVDEAHLPAVLAATRASVVVLMNLSRDQLDRGAEVKLLAARWRTMLQAVDWPLTAVANADDPLVAWAAWAAPATVWVGAGLWWRDDSALCPECSRPLERPGGARPAGPGWFCPACGLARPQTAWNADDDGITVPDGSRLTPDLRLPGRVNIGNAAIAAAAAGCWGVAPEAALAAFERVGDVDGRYVEAQAAGHPVRLLLGKNPASWTELIDMVAASGRSLVAVLNARGADGRDPSWLWDVPFERLAGTPARVAGERRYDLAVRFDTAGIDVAGVAEDPLEAVAAVEAGKPVDIVANYTAFQDLRARIAP
jgi:UDP-N-acetylmuramyl tripeptide synthase